MPDQCPVCNKSKCDCFELKWKPKTLFDPQSQQKGRKRPESAGITHGVWGYFTGKCRCEICCELSPAYQRQKSAERKAIRAAGGEVKRRRGERQHGTTMYSYGCRCDVCRLAKKESSLKYTSKEEDGA